MNTIRDELSTIMTICGCVVGAGFVSGKELLMILGNSNTILNGVIFALMYGILIYAIMLHCLKQDINSAEQWTLSLAGKYSAIITILLLLCYMCMTVTMLAMISQTMNVVLNIPTNLPIYGTIVAVAVSVFLYNGATGLRLLCSLSLPIIIIVILVCAYTNRYSMTITWDMPNITQCASYALFNGVMSIGVLIPISNCKHKAFVSISSATILAILIILILSVMDSQPINSYNIPLLSLATDINHMVLYTICILLSATVSVATNSYILTNYLYTITSDRLLSVTIVMLIALLLSLFGLDMILVVMYPLVSVIGIIMLILALLNTKQHAI